MMMKSVFPALLTLLLVGCATTAQPVQKAQKVNVNRTQSAIVMPSSQTG